MNLAKALAIILATAVVAIIAVYLMGQFEQTRPAYEQITGALGTAKESLVGFVSQPTGAIATASTAAGSIGGLAALYSKLSATKRQVTELSDKAKAEIDSVTAQKNALTEKLQGYENQAKELEDMKKQLEESNVDTGIVTGLKDKLQTTQSSLESVQLQKASLENQLAELKRERDKAFAQLEVLTPKYK